MGQIEQLVKSKLLGNDNPNNLVWPITKTQAVYDKTNTDLQTVLDSLGSEVQEIKKQFITRMVDDLANYYLKSETCTRAEIAEQIANAINGEFVVVNSLPAASSSTLGKIYLVPSSSPEVQNIKDEFITVQNNGNYSWEQIGSTALSIGGVVSYEHVQSLTSQQKTTARTNIGAGTYSKPSNGIPASDLANGVIPTVPSIDPTPTANSTNLVTSGGVKSYVDNNSAPEAVKYVAQSLTAEQKQQARTNIGAGDFSGNPIVNLGTPSTPDGTIIATLANGDTVTIDLNHNHPQYYSKTIETTQPQGGFLPDVVYNLGTLTGTVAFALADAVSGYVNHYFWTFTTSSTAPTVTWPSGITWADGTGPTVTANKYYEISILGGIATYIET